MSESSDKGKALEVLVTKTLQKKLGARVQRDGKSGAGSHQKMDISDYFGDTRLAVECKDQKAIQIKKWFSQAAAGAPPRQIPTVVFKGDGEVLATLRFTDLVDLLAEMQQDQAENRRLKEPVTLEVENDPAKLVEKAVGKVSAAKVCPNGHLVSPGSKKCLAKGCPYSSSYKRKKEKK